MAGLKSELSERIFLSRGKTWKKTKMQWSLSYRKWRDGNSSGGFHRTKQRETTETTKKGTYGKAAQSQ